MTPVSPLARCNARAARTEKAVERALAFLTRSQLQSGAFNVVTSTDPSLTTNCVDDPSVFPTALVAQCLSATPTAADLCARACDFLLAERDRHGLWRHWTRDHPQFRQLPPDLDDSSCASAALAACGIGGGTDPGLFFANRDRGNRFFTWVVPRPRWTGIAHLRASLPQLLHAPTLIAFFRATSAAPGDVDAVVNANCLHYLGAFPGSETVADMLLAILARRGEASCDKWYENPFVVRYFFSRALARLAPSAEASVCERIASERPATALEMALAAAGLLHWGRADEEAIDRLVAAQQRDGSWPRAALYSGGRERHRDGSFAPRHPDTPHWGSEEISTAFAVEALSGWLRATAR